MQSVVIQDVEWRDEFGKKLFELQQTGQFCDVIIKTVEDARLLVHSCVLAAASPLLKGVIESALNDTTLGTIMLSSDIDVNTWTHMLEFMYTGGATVPDSLVASLQSGATILKVDTLVERCNEILPTIVTKIEEPIPSETQDIYSAIAQIKEDNDAVVEQESVEGKIATEEGIMVMTTEAMVEGSIITQEDHTVESAEGIPDNTEATVIDDGGVQEADVGIAEEENAVDETAVVPETHETLDAQDAMDTQDYIDDVHDIQSAPVEVVQQETITENITNQSASKEGNNFPLARVTSGENSQNINFNVRHVSEASDIKFEFFGYRKNGRKTYKCLLCGKVVRERSEHRVAHMTNKKFKCHFQGCQKVYKRRQGLKLHEQTHASNSACHKCEKCGKSYRTEHLLYKHRTATCYNLRTYSCRICNKQVKTLRQLRYHEANHSDIKSVYCEICHKAFSTQQHLRMHLSTHNSIMCHCGESFDTWTECKSHKQQDHCYDSNTFKIKTSDALSETKIEQEKLECKICRVKFKKKSQLHLHMVNHSEPNIPCSICGKKYKTKSAMKSHLLSHNKPFECSTCSEKFSLLKALQKHAPKCFDSTNNESVKFQCECCDKTFFSSVSARKHIAENHSNEHLVRVKSLTEEPISCTKVSIPGAIYNCELCAAVFRLEPSLVKHEIEKHSYKNGKHKCSICGVLFITTRTLRKHEYYEHQVGTLHLCDHCDREFFTEDDLILHKYSVHDIV